jgi:hypothetical protein
MATSVDVRSVVSGFKWDHLTLREASMKKLTAILLTLCVMSVAFVGCNDTASTTKTTKEKTTTTTPPGKTP